MKEFNISEIRTKYSIPPEATDEQVVELINNTPEILNELQGQIEQIEEPSSLLPERTITEPSTTEAKIKMGGKEYLSASTGQEDIPTTGAKKFIAETLTDPATYATLPFGGVTGGTLKRGATAGIKLLASKIAKRGAESAISAGIHQGQNIMESGKISPTAAITELGAGFVLPVAGKIVKPFFKSATAKKMAESIVEKRVAPLPKAYKDGFDVENYFKYNVLGDTPETTEKLVQDRIFKAMKKINKHIKSKESGVDLVSVVDRTFDEMKKNKKQFAGLMAGKQGETEIDKAAEYFRSIMLNSTDQTGFTDLVGANDMRQVIGKKALFIQGTKVEGSDAKTEFANNLYKHFREVIDRTIDNPELKKLNKEVSDLIPLRDAATRKIPIEKRTSPVGFHEGISTAVAAASGNVLPLAVPLANRAGKAPAVAQIAYSYGKFLEKKEKTKTGQAVKTVLPYAGVVSRQAMRNLSNKLSGKNQ